MLVRQLIEILQALPEEDKDLMVCYHDSDLGGCVMFSADCVEKVVDKQCGTVIKFC